MVMCLKAMAIIGCDCFLIPVQCDPQSESFAVTPGPSIPATGPGPTSPAAARDSFARRGHRGAGGTVRAEWLRVSAPSHCQDRS